MTAPQSAATIVRMRRSVAVTLSILGLLLLGAWAALPWAAQALLPRLAPELSADIRHLGLFSAELHDVRYGEIAQANVLRLSYSPLTLLAHHVDEVAAEGLRLRGLPPAGDEESRGAAWSLGRLRLADARVELAASGWSLDATIDGSIDLVSGEIDLPVLRLSFDFLHPHVAMTVSASGGAGHNRSLDLAVDIPDGGSATFWTRGLRLTTQGELVVQDGPKLAYVMRQPGSLGTRIVSVPGLFSTKPFTAEVQPTTLVAAEWNDDGLEVRPDLVLAKAVIAATFESTGEKPLAITLDLPAMRLGGAWRSAESAFDPVGRIDGGAIKLPHGLVIDDLSVAAVDVEDSTLPVVALRGTLRDGAKSRRMVPLAIDGRLRPEGESVSFSASLADAANRLRLSLLGQYGQGGGRANLSLKPLPFGAELQPADLFPSLADSVVQASGVLAARGDLRWGSGGFLPHLEVLARDLSAQVSGMRFRRLNSVLTFNGLSPLSTPPEQEASLALVQAGLPMTNALLRFQMQRGVLNLAGGQLDLAGGRVSLRDARLDPAAKQHRLWLDVRGLDLATLVSQVELDGLAATGRLDGTIPVEFGGNGLRVAGASLTAAGPGRLYYRPTQPPAALTGGGPADILMQALGDFRYERLAMGLDGDANGEIVAKLSLFGANPAFYDGYPVELNLTVSGRLARILSDALTGYRIPDKIAERMAGFEAATNEKDGVK